MAETEEELKSLLMRVKGESEKAGLKLNIQKTKIMASSPMTSLKIDGETMETVTDFIFLCSKITGFFFSHRGVAKMVEWEGSELTSPIDIPKLLLFTEQLLIRIT